MELSSILMELSSILILQFHSDPAHKLSANLFYIYHCCVYSKKTPDDGQRNCPKHVEFYSRNNFEKLVHLVGFIIRNFHDALSPEHQTLHFLKKPNKVSTGESILFNIYSHPIFMSRCQTLSQVGGQIYDYRKTKSIFSP